MVEASIGALFAILLSEPLYRDTLYNDSLDLIVQIQSAASASEISFWKTYTQVSLYAMCIGIPLVYNVYIRNRQKVVYYAVCVTVNMFLTNFLKLVYADPRPFWSSDNIQALSCYGQYGNPSGHCIFGYSLPMIFILDLIAENASL